jgi:hypothetical protein
VDFPDDSQTCLNRGRELGRLISSIADWARATPLPA